MDPTLIVPAPKTLLFSGPVNRSVFVHITSRLPITIKEARKLLGARASSQLSDEQIAILVDELDFLAELAIKTYRKQLP